MAFFKKKKEEKNTEAEVKKLNSDLKDDISKAYDEIMANGLGKEKNEQPAPSAPAGDFEAEVLKSKIKEFKEKKTQEALLDVIKMLPGRYFLLPSVSNVEQPFEKQEDGTAKLKQGAVLNPALLTGQDGKVFLPIFTDEKSMVQKSPSGALLRFTFEQCVTVVYDKKNPVCGVVINPFTENMIIGEELLRMVFKEKKTEE